MKDLRVKRLMECGRWKSCADLSSQQEALLREGGVKGTFCLPEMMTSQSLIIFTPRQSPHCLLTNQTWSKILQHSPNFVSETMELSLHLSPPLL